MKLACAWCPRPENEAPETSHSICPEHEQMLRDQSDVRNWPKVPSYVENRKEFEQYREEKQKRRR